MVGEDAGPVEERLAEARNEIHLGHRSCELVPIALGEAARDHEPGARSPAPRELEDGVHRLLSGGLYEGTGVDHDDVCVLRIAGGVQSGHGERSRELRRVDFVLRAAESLQPIARRHRANLPADQVGTLWGSCVTPGAEPDARWSTRY